MDMTELKRLSVIPTTLSDAILAGCATTKECRGAFFWRGHTCAIGAALTGLTGSYAAALGARGGLGTCWTVAGRLKIPLDVVYWASETYETTDLSREDIAAQLKAKGH